MALSVLFLLNRKKNVIFESAELFSVNLFIVIVAQETMEDQCPKDATTPQTPLNPLKVFNSV